jgi:ArsR family transcriptional regulator, arsenate/arsenite/antimonite-responsive transcriptional repressor
MQKCAAPQARSVATFRWLALAYRFDYSKNMETRLTLSALTALGHETRLTVFRLLVQQGPAGLPAGEIALRLGVPAPTLSFHLKELERGQLVRSTRQQRQIIYAADYAGTRALLDFLMQDCCQGRPEICGVAGAGACATSPSKEAADA